MPRDEDVGIQTKWVTLPLVNPRSADMDRSPWLFGNDAEAKASLRHDTGTDVAVMNAR